MPVKCKNCGCIHWDEIPTLRDTFETIKIATKVNIGKNGTPLRFTSKGIRETFGISEQNASNRVKQLEDLGVIEHCMRKSQNTGGYIDIYKLSEDYLSPKEVHKIRHGD